jgi:serine/threonine protein kinase
MPTAPTITAVGSSVHIAELPEIGDAIGRYRIVGELGAGAMGTVFLASDPQLGRRIAVKVLTRSARDDRLLDEARAMARLQHERGRDPRCRAVARPGLHRMEHVAARRCRSGSTTTPGSG